MIIPMPVLRHDIRSGLAGWMRLGYDPESIGTREGGWGVKLVTVTKLKLSLNPDLESPTFCPEHAS